MAIQIVYKNSEVKLVEALNNIQEPHGWHAIHFHLSQLLEQYQSDYQIKIAVNLIYDLLKTYEGGIYLLQDRGIIVLCSRLERTLQNKLIFQLRYLYMDDPLAYTEDGQENLNFCTSFDLGRDWQVFFDECTRRMARTARRGAVPIPERPQPKEPETPPMPRLSSEAYLGLSASRLAGIERDVRYADLSHVLRRQPVCIAQPDAPVRRMFDELYIHIAHLRQMLKSDVDFLSNRWLFKYLTHILDERMMELLKQSPMQYMASPVSLNLNVETLLSSAFAEFDAMLKPETKVSVVIEVPVVDVFADMAAFMFARQEMQKLGYRICLDGVTTRSLSAISREQLGVDLVKVQWNADVQADLKSAENQKLAGAVQGAGTNRVILCRCDNKQAVEYGQALGISLFQGRYIDSLIDPAATVQN